MPKKLKITASALGAWRSLWRDRQFVFAVSWIPITFSFMLMIAALHFPVFKTAARFLEQGIFSIFAVAIFRKELLAESPLVRRVGDADCYFRFGRTEAIYTAWSVTLIVFGLIVHQLATMAGNVPLVGWIAADYIWPIIRDLMLSVVILVGPFLAVAENPLPVDIIPIAESVTGNIINILTATFFISSPYYVFDWISGKGIPWLLLMHGLYCLCLLAQIKFAATVYKHLVPGISRPG